MEPALSVGAGFSPLDEELELDEGGGSLSPRLHPRLHEWLVRLSAWMPFEQAATLLGDFTRVQVSEATTRRQSEAAGAAYEVLQTQEVERIERTLPPSPQGPIKQLLSVDGAMVPLLHGQWAEVKTMVLGEVEEPVLVQHKDDGKEREEWVIHTWELSYFSRMTDADTFGRLALWETQRRGVERAGQVVAVMDGAEWQQGFVDYHCPNAIRILDFPHAAERLSGIANALMGEGTEASKEWLGERCRQLKHEGPSPVLMQLRALQQAHPNNEVLATNLAYLSKREEQMQYPRYQKEGWPIGSGAVESGNKLVVQARLKGAGMHWEGSHVNPMLGLRNIVCNDRWAEAWPQITDQIRQQGRARKHKQAKQAQVLQMLQSQYVGREQREQREQQHKRQVQNILLPIPTPNRRPKPIATLTDDNPDNDNPKAPCRPAPDHPWRRSPIGRARFQSAKAS